MGASSVSCSAEAEASGGEGLLGGEGEEGAEGMAAVLFVLVWFWVGWVGERGCFVWLGCASFVMLDQRGEVMAVVERTVAQPGATVQSRRPISEF
mgnify:CR=1 FL=1